jgi:26S proteasome regulatory subunit N1
LYLGKQEKADVMLEAVRTVEHKRGRYAEITLNTCAYAGTGNVLKVRLAKLLHCNRVSRYHQRELHHPADTTFLHYLTLSLPLPSLQVQEMLRICAEHLTDDAEHQSVAVLGIALVVLGEDVGTEVSSPLDTYIMP